MGALVPPLAMFPVSKIAMPSSVAVCVVPAMLCQETFWPTVTVSGLGEKEFDPAIATMLIVTSAPGPAGPVGFDFLQESARSPAPRTNAPTSTEPNMDFIKDLPWSEQDRRMTPIYHSYRLLAPERPHGFVRILEPTIAAAHLSP